MVSDKEICPICKTTSVYDFHQGDIWKIKCIKCGISTRVCKSWRESRREWDRMCDIIKNRDK